MVNKLHDKVREAFLKDDIDRLNDAIKAISVDTADYTPVERRGINNRPYKL